jgi:hypothetical protein
MAKSILQAWSASPDSDPIVASLSASAAGKPALLSPHKDAMAATSAA